MGYPEWDRSRDDRDHQAPETGRWDLRQERWIPQQRVPEGDDFGIEPFQARSNPRARPGEGRILDHEEWGTGHHRQYVERGRGDEYYDRTQRRPKPRAKPEDDEDEDDPRSTYIGSFISTALWYFVPIAGYSVWSLTLSTSPRAGCTNEFGLPCPAPRTEALANLLDHGPQIAVALALSISFAMLLGWATSGWRPFAIGFASAVLGAGVATVLFAVLATQF